MDKQQTIHKLSTLCKVLAVAVSGFNSARKGAISARENEDQCYVCMLGCLKRYTYGIRRL